MEEKRISGEYGEIVVYQTEDGLTRLDVKFENETVWLTQMQMSELFQTSKQNISLHINNCFKEGELQPEAVVKESLTTASDGKHYRTKFYNLDVIILEGIMNADWYHPLFEFAAELFGKEIYAYYFDVPFEETLKRHQTRSKRQEFGEKEMRRWWREKDFSDVLNEKRITSYMSMESIVTEIYRDGCSGE
ncbi:MAG: hypothetical protein LUC25_03940 [Ruminococcus sp.]|nr:hypothetical protein [Ruminococcus sp.]